MKVWDEAELFYELCIRYLPYQTIYRFYLSSEKYCFARLQEITKLLMYWLITQYYIFFAQICHCLSLLVESLDPDGTQHHTSIPNFRARPYASTKDKLIRRCRSSYFARLNFFRFLNDWTINAIIQNLVAPTHSLPIATYGVMRKTWCFVDVLAISISQTLSFYWPMNYCTINYSCYCLNLFTNPIIIIPFLLFTDIIIVHLLGCSSVFGALCILRQMLQCFDFHWSNSCIGYLYIFIYFLRDFFFTGKAQ